MGSGPTSARAAVDTGSRAEGNRGSLFAGRSPPQAERSRRLVILALHGVNGAAVVESEDLVAQVEAGGDHLQSPVQAKTALYIELGMGVEVVVAGGAFQPNDRITRRTVRHIPLICGDAGVVVADREPARKATFIVREIEVVVIGGIAVQVRFIGSAAVKARRKTYL